MKKLSVETTALLFIVLVSVFRLIYVSGLNVLPDEAYYFLWSKHLAWSYFDHPPMIAYLFALLNLIMSDHALVVKLVAISLTAFTSVYGFLLATELFDRVIALYYVVLVNMILLFMAGSIVATPDTPMIFFLTGASYYFYLAVKQGRYKFWFLAGIFTGLSLLSKYIALLIYPSFFCYLALPENRKWLKHPIPYLSFLMSLIIFSPVILWNYANNWVSFKFQIKHGLGGTHFPNWTCFAEFLGGQAGIIGPILFVLFLMSLVYVLVKWKNVSLEEKFLWFAAVVPFAFFSLSSLRNKVEANWPAFAYIPGILLVIGYYERTLKSKKWSRYIWRIHWIYTGLVLALLLVYIYLPFMRIKRHRTGEFFGWDQLGKEAMQLAKENPGFMLAANRHQIASEIEFYSNQQVVCLNIENRSNQFDLWQAEDSLEGENFLFFDTRNHPEKAVVDRFEAFELLKTILLQRGKKALQQIRVFRTYNYRQERVSNPADRINVFFVCDDQIREIIF